MSGSAKNPSSKALLYFLKVSLYIYDLWRVEGGGWKGIACQIRQLGGENLNMQIFQSSNVRSWERVDVEVSDV